MECFFIAWGARERIITVLGTAFWNQYYNLGLALIFNKLG